ncbi:MAG: hypothetical protein ABIR47_02655 [Candidatus Kapaibacterium sp.]
MNRYTTISALATMGIVLLACSGGSAFAQQKKKPADRGGRDKSKHEQSAPVPAKRAEPDNSPVDLARKTYQDNGGTVKRQPRVMAPVNVEPVQLNSSGENEREKIQVGKYAGFESAMLARQPFYAEGTLGIFTTAGIRLNYIGTSWPYDYSAQIKFASTNGFVTNARRTSVEAGVNGGYVIGDNYGIFSGGHMGGEISYGNDRYTLYAVDPAPERRDERWNVGASGRNSYKGTTFDLKGNYRSLAMTGDSATNERTLEGGANISTGWLGLTVGGGANLQLTTLKGTSINYGRVNLFAAYTNTYFKLQAGANGDFAGNSDGTSSDKILPSAEVQLYPLRGITISAGVSGGINPVSLQRLLDKNPYVSSNPLVRHEVEGLGYRAAVRIEPWESFGLRVLGSRRRYDNYSFFSARTSATFDPRYDAATVTSATGDIYWQIDGDDLLALVATYNDGQLGAAGTRIPYLPTINAEAMYGKRLSNIPLSITATLHYIGERTGATDSLAKPVTLINLKGRYTINGHFDAMLELDNLINQNYELWSGYGERGIFGSIGIAVRY